MFVHHESLHECSAGGTDGILDKSPWSVNGRIRRFHRAHFSDFTAREVRYAAAFIYGLAEMFVEDVRADVVIE